MYLVVREPEIREERWYGTPRRGVLTVGAAPEGDVQLVGHNIAARHLQLDFGARERVRIEVRHPWGVRLDGRPPRPDALLVSGAVLRIGSWALGLEDVTRAPDSAIDDAFFTALHADPGASDERLVYGDSLEERGWLAEAELVRAATTSATAARLAELAVRTAPPWRRRLFVLPIEGCPRKHDEEDACPGHFSGLPPGPADTERTCGACTRRVMFCEDIGSARVHASKGRPVVLDPAVRRWPDDLREPARKRLAIEMGRPARR